MTCHIFSKSQETMYPPIVVELLKEDTRTNSWQWHIVLIESLWKHLLGIHGYLWTMMDMNQILLDPVGFLAGLWCQCAQENPTGCLALCNIARSARNDKEKLVRRGIFWHLKTLSKQNQQVDSLWAHVFLRTGCLKDAFKERQPRTSMINVRETLNACILLDAPSNLNRGSGSPGTVSPTTLCTYVHKLHLPGQKADAKK